MVPATRVITPSAETFRTTWLPVSAIRNPPSAVTATPRRAVEPGVGSCAAVAAAPGNARGPGDPGDLTVGRDLPDDLIEAVDDQESAIGGHRHPNRAVGVGCRWQAHG